MDTAELPKGTVIIDCLKRRVGFVDDTDRFVEVCFPKPRGSADAFLLCCSIALAQNIVGSGGSTAWTGANERFLTAVIEHFHWNLGLNSLGTYWVDFKHGRSAVNPRTSIMVDGKGPKDQFGLAESLFQRHRTFFLGSRQEIGNAEYIYWPIQFLNSTVEMEALRDFITRLLAPSSPGMTIKSEAAENLVTDKQGRTASKRDGRLRESSLKKLQGYVIRYESFLEDRIRNFGGRRFVFDALEEFTRSNPCGYFIIRGDPGIGKSSVMAKLTQDWQPGQSEQEQYRCVHHFNIRAEGLNRTEIFLTNICAQIILTYRLDYDDLPQNIAQDGRFLNTLLTEVSENLDPQEKLLLLVDALDEVDTAGAPMTTNLLCLPYRLPQGVFIIATTRPQQVCLSVDSSCPLKPFDIVHNHPNNLRDIEAHLQEKVSTPGLRSYIQKRGLTPEHFVKHMLKKSDGNFMYLRHVLPEMENGHYQSLDFKDLPVGLENYYDDHWRRMGMMAEPLPKEKIRIIYILSEVLQPVSCELLSDFSKTDEIVTQSVLDEWSAFLHKKPFNESYRYALYHSSFKDFLNRKDIVKSAGVSIEMINSIIADNLYEDLYGDE